MYVRKYCVNMDKPTHQKSGKDSERRRGFSNRRREILESSEWMRNRLKRWGGAVVSVAETAMTDTWKIVEFGVAGIVESPDSRSATMRVSEQVESVGGGVIGV